MMKQFRNRILNEIRFSKMRKTETSSANGAMHMTDVKKNEGSITLYPVNSQLAYFIRNNLVDNSNIKDIKRPFDIYIVIGSEPTHDNYRLCQYVCSTASKDLARDLVHTAIARAESLVDILNKVKVK